MTVREALTETRRLKPNEFDDATLVRWLSELDRKLYDDALCVQAARAGARDAPPAPYSERADMDTELLLPFPHGDLYVKYLGAQIDYHNAEFDRYNNGMRMFNAGYQAYADWVNRTKPKAPVYIRGVKAGRF